jgi:thymidylate kinase
VKDYVIPWKELLFLTRVKDNKYNIYITNPNLELLLLSVRLVVKSKWRNRLRGIFGSYNMPRSMREEFFDLREKIQKPAFLDMIEKTCPAQNCQRVYDILMEKDPLRKTFPEFQRIVRTTFEGTRRLNGIQSATLSTYYNLRRKITQKVKNHSDCVVSIKKISLVSGNIIAFVGVDGAGKSTITGEIYKWLNQKVECRRYYLGAGSKNRSGIISFISKTLKKLGGRSRESVEQSRLIDRLYWKSQIWNILNAERIINKRMRAMQRYTLNGGVALLDRYPQIEMIGVNDGPKIVAYADAFHHNRYIQKKIEKENEYLNIVKSIKPDLVMRINISVETSMKRKPEQRNTEIYQKKIDNLRMISFQNAKIVDIDGEQSMENEIMEIRRKIWEMI